MGFLQFILSELAGAWYTKKNREEEVNAVQKPSMEEIAEWKTTYEKYRPYLSANRKPVSEMLRYLVDRYPVREVTDPKLRALIGAVLMQNKYYAQKLGEAEPRPRLFVLKNEEGAVKLYRHRAPKYADSPIFIGTEEVSGYVSVEGCDELADELTAFLGLDEQDLDNFFLVSRYIGSLRRLDLPLPGEGLE